jgi:hypothetical protein
MEVEVRRKGICGRCATTVTIADGGGEDVYGTAIGTVGAVGSLMSSPARL